MNIRILSSGSSGNAYTVSDGQTTLLIECGLPWKQLSKLLNYHLCDIDACLVTHEHGDHAKSAKKLASFGIDVYLSQGTKNALGANERGYRVLQKAPDATYASVSIKTMVVYAFSTVHDAAEPVGFFIKSRSTNESLVFLTDSAYCVYHFKHVDYWMIEVNYISDILDQNALDHDIHLQRRNRTVLNHMSLDTAIDFLRKSHAQEARAIYVMHLSDANSDEKRIQEALHNAFRVPVYLCS